SQTQNQTQNVGSDCGCKGKDGRDGHDGGSGNGGPGGAQLGLQYANTEQGALAAAVSKQNAVNANSPVSIAGGNITGGASSATQDADSRADSKARNDAYTSQFARQIQFIG